MNNKCYRLEYRDFRPKLKDDETIHFSGLKIKKYKNESGHNGKFEITEKTLSDVKKNLTNMAYGNEIFAYKVTESDGTAHGGKRKNLALVLDSYIKENELILKLSPLNEEAKQELLSGELQYGSPDLFLNYTTLDTNKQIGAVISGYCLCDDPYQTGLTPAYKLSKKKLNYLGGNKMEDVNKILSSLEAIQNSISGEQKNLAKGSDAVISAAIKSLSKLSETNSELKTKVEKLELEKKQVEEKSEQVKLELEKQQNSIKLSEQKMKIEEAKTQKKILPFELKKAESAFEKNELLPLEMITDIEGRTANCLSALSQISNSEKIQTEKKSLVELAKELNPEKFLKKGVK